MGPPGHRLDGVLPQAHALRAERRHGRVARHPRRAGARGGEGALSGLLLSGGAVLAGLGLAGAAWGVVADRLAARWPTHEDGTVRRVDWRTVVVALTGAAAAVGVAFRYGDGLGQGPRDSLSLGPVGLALVGAYVLTLVVLLATDLDQRLLPDVLTLPWIPVALVATVLGLTPAATAGAGLPGAIGVAVGVPVVLFVLSIPFGSGAIGIGDLKLLVSVGLLAGLERTVLGLLAGALLGGVCIGALLLARRIGLRSFVPYGPFLIAGAIWSLLMPA